MTKTIKNLLWVMCLTASALLTLTSSANAQIESKDKIKSMLNARSYTFRAETAIPQRGGTRYLTSEYDLKVSKDTIIAFLPYFGRAYRAPMDPTQGGIKFTSTDFSYDTEKKKRGWEITITPKDARDADVRYLVLSISDSGYGSLRVISNNRDGISFSGYISAGKQK